MVRPEFDKSAVAIRPRAAWADLVLPPRELKKLRLISADARGRFLDGNEWIKDRANAASNGMLVLFVGAVGTGKTLAAEVLANELGRPLYRIDLSRIVSKYVGETEKNLARLFDSADVDGAILLFDEADALFGKRGEVKDSHDRHANIEVGYLLQRVESRRGLTILATNQRSAIDRAVLRRSAYAVDFRSPAPKEP